MTLFSAMYCPIKVCVQHGHYADYSGDDRKDIHVDLQTFQRLKAKRYIRELGTENPIIPDRTVSDIFSRERHYVADVLIIKIVQNDDQKNYTAIVQEEKQRTVKVQFKLIKNGSDIIPTSCPHNLLFDKSQLQKIMESDLFIHNRKHAEIRPVAVFV